MTGNIREAAHLRRDTCQFLLQLLDRLRQGACLLLKLQKLTTMPSQSEPPQGHLGQTSNSAYDTVSRLWLLDATISPTLL